MPWRLLVVDGADARRFFPLPESGTVVIGNSHRHADICLNDLVMGRVHCQLDIDGEDVTVTALVEDKATQIDGQTIASQSLGSGQILRVGNTQLRLEPDDGSRPDEEDATAAQPKELPTVGFDQMEQLVGTRWGHFDLLKVLGRGHTAVTFRAHDNQSHREVALKVIGPAFPASSEELQQFARVIRRGGVDP